MYIYGGTFTMRYCYIHDSLQAQNFHIRASNSTLEYNWFARAKNYEGDLMVDDDFSGNGPFTQSMLLRGNIFVQSQTPGNHSQVIAIFDDTGLANENMSVQLINNTYVGNGLPNNGGGGAAFVHLSNADGTQMSAQLDNNIISGTTLPVLVEDTTKATVRGGNNWLATGVNPGTLTNSVFSATPGFINAATNNYALAASSAAIGHANQSPPGLPSKEYYRDETLAREYRLRTSVKDIGALESTTAGAGIGPYDSTPAPPLSAKISDGNVVISWPIYATGYVVEQTSALNGSNSWTQVTGGYVTNVNGFSLTLPLSASNSFYRLRMQ